MSIAHNTVVAKIAATAAGFGLVAMSFASALPAAAQTTTTTSTTASSTASLQAQIAALQAQLAAMSGTSATASVSFTRDLTMGSSGSDVTALQTWLIGKGFAISAGATGYFGSQTRAALAAYQAANAITPAAGYFGPITRAKVNATTSTTTTTTTTTGGTTGTTSTTLSGGEGSIDNFQVLGSPSNTSLYQGQMQQAYGFDFMADGSDLLVNRVDFDVTNTGVAINGGTGQDRPWSVLQTATLYDGSKVIGTVDASNQNNWSQDGSITATNGTTHQTYRLRFDNLNDVVKMGTQANYYVAFTADNGISNANQTQYSVVLASQGLRAVDAMGIQQYSPSNTATYSNGFTNSNAQIFYISNGTAGTVTFSTGSDNPQTGTVATNQSSNTQNVVLNTFTIQANSAATQIYDLPVYLTVPTTGVNPIQDLKLYQGSTLLDSESVVSGMTGTTTTSTGAPITVNGVPGTRYTILFNNLTNVTIPAGATQSFSIQADVNPVGGTNSGNASEGTSARVTVNPNADGVNNSNGTDIEQGTNRVVAMGASTGNDITFRTVGLTADAAPTTTATAVNNSSNATTQTGTFTFTFNVTAFGQDVYISQAAATAFDYTVYQGNATTTSTAAAISSTADRDSATQNFVIHSGQTKSVTVSITKNAGNNGYYYARLNHLYYATSTANLGATTSEQSITLPSAYQTNQVVINS